MAQPREKAELQFVIQEGTVVGNGSFFPTTTVKELKNYLMDSWPQEQSSVPKNVKEIKLIFNGKFLNDSWTLVKSGLLSDDLPRGIITVHVVVQQPPPPSSTTDESTESFLATMCGCPCTIL